MARHKHSAGKPQMFSLSPCAKHSEISLERWDLPHIDAKMLAEPIPLDCEHIVDSGFGRLITMEK